MRHSKLLLGVTLLVLTVVVTSFTITKKVQRIEVRPPAKDEVKAITYVGYFLYDDGLRINVFVNLGTGKVVATQFPYMFPPDYNYYYQDLSITQTYSASPRQITGLNVEDTPYGDINLTGPISLTYP